MADEQQTPGGTVRTTAPTPATFRAVPTVALVAVAFFALCMSPIAFQGGPWFLVFLVPLALAVWVVRGRTRADEEGLHVQRLFGSRSVAWSDLSGLRLPEKGWVHAVPTEGPEVELRGVRIRDLGRVAEASGNRISAPTPAEAEAAAEHARELEAARMRVAKLRERRAEAQAVDTAESTGDDAAAAEDGSAGTTDDTDDADGAQRREA
ncbi:PH domain-containing protein [Actinomycetospora sp. CA-084318]|uniref:PH domain-containing protein n=1 Tax=Actinomycetospora sp. CA-084318 TaxID=3239892 RepID=UPI003D9878A2